MSKQVDLSKPLSAADRDYLLSRDQHEAVAFNAVMHGSRLPEEVAQSIAARGITREATERRVRAARGEPETPEATPEPTGAVEDGSGDDSGPDDGPELFSDEWFDKAKIADLTPHLEKYNLSKTGKRDELADRLYEKLIDEGVIGEEDDSDS